MSKLQHWKKDEFYRNQRLIMKVLEEKGSIRFNELLESLNKTSKISPPTLSKHLRHLEDRGFVERFWDKKRKCDCYRINPKEAQKVKAKLQKYEAIRFLEGISNPVYVHKIKGNKQIAAFSSMPNVSRDKLEKLLNATISDMMFKFLPKAQPGQKTALVLMISGERDEA